MGMPSSDSEAPGAVDEWRSSPDTRKASVLSETAAAKTRSVAEAGVLKDLGLFVVMQRDGSIPLEPGHGLGIYHRDCRYLRGYDVWFADQPLQPLAASMHEGSHARFELVNPELCVDGSIVGPHSLGIAHSRRLDGADLTVVDRVEVRNYGDRDVDLPVRLAFDARFEDVFHVRGQAARTDGRIDGPSLDGRHARWRYRGTDGVERGLVIELPAGVRSDEDGIEGRPHACVVHFPLHVPARSQADFHVQIRLEDAWEGVSDAAPSEQQKREERSFSFRSDMPHLRETVDQSLVDIEMLSAEWHGHRFVMAGTPWFATLFGRDSSIVALQLIAVQPRLAADTARLLSRFQGTTSDGWRDEEPGKILHEVRRNELTNCGLLPYAPYYGTVDATPLFLMLVAAHARATGTTELFHDLRRNVDAALEHLQSTVDRHPEGFMTYESELDVQLIQKGWRDSCDGVVTRDGAVARPPIALVEVQAYVWKAWCDMAELLERCDEPERASRLRRQAAQLRERVHDRFTSDRLRGTFGLALWGERQQLADVLTSNPGHALWCGFAGEEVARCTARRLLEDDMFSGWGVRTLGTDEPAYNPVSYHRGSVWPHDNAIFAAGLRRYGHDEEALRVCNGVLEAAPHFESHRLPELFAGHPRASFPLPVRYPVACHPQAWAAGSIPMILQVLLGLDVDGAGRRAIIQRPLMPLRADRVELRGFRVGGERLDVFMERRAVGDPRARIHVLDGTGEVRVDVEEE